jgi:hypothetical protein
MEITKKVIEYIANKEIEAEQNHEDQFTFQAYSQSGIVMVGISIDEKHNALYFDCMSKLDIEDDNRDKFLGLANEVNRILTATSMVLDIDDGFLTATIPLMNTNSLDDDIIGECIGLVIETVGLFYPAFLLIQHSKMTALEVISKIKEDM